MSPEEEGNTRFLVGQELTHGNLPSLGQKLTHLSQLTSCGVVIRWKHRTERRPNMNRKLAIIVAIIALLCASALYALSYVSAAGHVHSKETIISTVVSVCGQMEICTVTTVIETLKIQRFDGSKVNADCMTSDVIRHECDIATPGDPAEGLAECRNGWCSWVELDVTRIGG